MGGETHTHSVAVQVEVVARVRGITGAHRAGAHEVEGGVAGALVSDTFVLVYLVDDPLNCVVIGRAVERVVVLHGYSTLSCLLAVDLPN